MNTFYALLALQILDLVSTVIALRNPSLKEANGPLAGLMKSIGTLPALMCYMKFKAWSKDAETAGGAAPTLTTSGRDRVFFMTEDGGTTWDATIAKGFA